MNININFNYSYFKIISNISVYLYIAFSITLYNCLLFFQLQYVYKNVLSRFKNLSGYNSFYKIYLYNIFRKHK